LVPSENILAGTIYLKVISRNTKGNHIFLELVARKKAPKRKRAIKYGSLENNCWE
jgi:hypothetical protein